MKNSYPSRPRAFTLFELLVVIAIIGILARELHLIYPESFLQL